MGTSYEDLMKTLHEMEEYAIKIYHEFVDAKLQNLLLYLEEIEKDLEKARETGVLNFDLLTNSSDSSKEVSAPTSTQSSSSSKENDKSISSRSVPSTRQLRSNALKELSQLVNVQVQEKKIDLVIVDSDEEAPRPKRTRARTKTTKTEEVVESTRSTRSKTRAKKNLETENQFNQSLNDSKAKPNGDETPKAACDSSDEDQFITKLATKSKKNLYQKRLRGSSAEDNSFVKKKVEAFEKLGAVSHSATASGGRVTRGRAQQATPTHKQLNKFSSKTALGSCERTNNRNLTPSTFSALKSRSAPKSSQAEFRERELRRQQIEIDAIAKKAAVLQARMQKRRRKIEERRQLKAQRLRYALSKTKQSAFEAADKRENCKMDAVQALHWSRKIPSYMKQFRHVQRSRSCSTDYTL